jgi:prepilin-type N-terminal cleavage/methylation domain-containing protein
MLHIRQSNNQGFTLAEMSIVLVIIGLILGAIVVGQEMIAAAGIRAAVSQVNKYQAAVSAFTAKYQALPGDMPAKIANKYGFVARGTHEGQGDGNGVLECWNGSAASGICQGDGETSTFWIDLSQAGMIEGGFINANGETSPIGAGAYNIPHSSPLVKISDVLPPSAIGNGNYVYVYSANGVNYIGISYIVGIQTADLQEILSTPGMTVSQAFNLDTKIDDGLPQSGTVTATYTNSSGIQWSAGGGVTASNTPFKPSLHDALGISDAMASGGGGPAPFGTPNTAATPSTSTTCYDNGNVNGAVQKYTMGNNAGRNVNCAVSIGVQTN